MSTSLKDLAISFALQNDWQNACDTNLKILAQNPQDIDTLNRLAFSYMKLAHYRKAKKTYKIVIDFDKTNPIAVKNLKKLELISKQKPSGANEGQATNGMNVSSYYDMFIEEAGKTKTMELKNVADKKTLTLLQPGESVRIAVKRSKIFIQTVQDKYIGVLPDSMGLRLIKFIQGGNEYQAYIKSVDEKNVTIFLKEVKRAQKFKNQPSFSVNFAYATSEND